ncbi:MAG: HlyD family efflux transporter periplasmic adaptor subunit [Eubacteriales bacterium]
MVKKHKLRPSKRFYIIAVILAALAVIFLCLNMLLPKTAIVTQGEIMFEDSFNGVVVRDESVYEAENYGKAIFIAEEGSAVTVGEEIAEVYKWGYNEQTMADLIDIREQIMDYQLNTLLKNIINVNLADYNSKIEDKSIEIRQVISGEKEGNPITLERELSDLMNQRRDYLNTAVPLDNTLSSLYDQETALEERINAWKVYIYAEEEKIVSFYFDKYESLISTDNMDKLTISNIKEILKGSITNTLSNTDSSKPLYRLVNQNEWYVIVMADKQKNEITVDSQFSVVFKNIYDKQYTATVVSERSDPKGYIYILKITDDIGDLLSARSVNFSMKNTFSGLVVPSAAVKTSGDTNYVQVKTADDVIEVKVKIVAEQNKKSIVEPLEDNQILTANVQVVY